MQPISSVKHWMESPRPAVSVCVSYSCVCAQNSPLPRRQLAKMHTRAARSFPRQGVYLSCRRGARSASPPWLPCCRTLVCASSLSHKSPGTDGRRVVGWGLFVFYEVTENLRNSRWWVHIFMLIVLSYLCHWCEHYKRKQLYFKLQVQGIPCITSHIHYI